MRGAAAGERAGQRRRDQSQPGETVAKTPRVSKTAQVSKADLASKRVQVAKTIH
jgi:hypothetical protein